VSNVCHNNFDFYSITTGCDFFANSSDLRERTNLLQEFHHANLGPVFRDFSILQTVDVDLRPLNLFVGWGRSHHRTLVSGSGRTSFDDLVAGRDEILFGHHNIRESAVHHYSNLPETFVASRERPAEVMYELLVKQMRDTVNVVLVLEDSRELPNDLLVIFFLHFDLFFDVQPNG